MHGATIWLTGLSGSGKTTLAGLVAADIRTRGLLAEVLDADVLRPRLSRGLSLSRDDRNELVRRVGFIGNLLSKHGVYAVVAAVAPYREVREQARAAANGRFFEVYLATSFDDCARRDARGIYAHALAGRVQHFPGLSVPYEPPRHPDMTLLTTDELPEASARRIIAALERHGIL